MIKAEEELNAFEFATDDFPEEILGTVAELKGTVNFGEVTLAGFTFVDKAIEFLKFVGTKEDPRDDHFTGILYFRTRPKITDDTEFANFDIFNLILGD